MKQMWLSLAIERHLIMQMSLPLAIDRCNVFAAQSTDIADNIAAMSEAEIKAKLIN